MLARCVAAVLCLAVVWPAAASAQDDAGDTFFDAEELDFGQLSVSGYLLTEMLGPDLYLGTRDGSGAINLTDDDSSPYGDDYAPALYNVPVNPGGEIAFDITSYEDTEFTGEHTQFGDFEVFVDVFTYDDDVYTYLDSLYLPGYLDYLEPEQAIFSYVDSDPAWEGASYDIQVNNAFPNDVDFFRFNGLTPGEGFTAETLPVDELSLDTVLGLFDENGDLIASDDDGGQFTFSKLSGVVPASGEVVLAVSGFGDIDYFEGYHPYKGPYELTITLGEITIPGDYDGDQDVDADDYTAWANAYGSTGQDLAADGNGDDRVDAADYTVWRDAYDAQPLAVPEPAALVWVALVGGAVRSRRA